LSNKDVKDFYPTGLTGCTGYFLPFRRKDKNGSFFLVVNIAFKIEHQLNRPFAMLTQVRKERKEFKYFSFAG